MRTKQTPSPIELRPEPTVVASAVPRADAAPEPAACPRLVVAAGNEPLIDDFEDQNARLILTDGRDGTWAVYSDGTAPQILPAVNWPWHPRRLPTPRVDSRYAIHVVGAKMAKWGAVMTVDLSAGACYDVSAYAGLEFWGKGTTRVHVSLTEIDSVPTAQGGLCTVDDCPASAAKPIDLAKTWTRYRITWDELAQLSVPPTKFDPSRVITLAFGFHAQDSPFDVWIDDVRFVERH
jgi:hypothetical protein